MPKFRTVEKSDDTRTAKRVFAVGAVFACSFGILACRALSFHLKDNGEIEKVAMRQYRTAVHQSTRRGRILDSAGRELAIDATVESIYANPREVDDPVEFADKLSKMLKTDRRKLLDRFTAGRKFVWLKRRAADAEAAQVMGQNFKGVYSMKESSRTYPGKLLASAVLGAVGFDSAPLGGIELSYNGVLSSTTGKSGDMRRDARGHLYLSPTDEGQEQKLADVELTIDRTLQYIAERELEKAVAKSHAKGGSAIVVDVETGAVMAMANYPTFDPNDYESYSLSSWKNRSISDAYEPGSTFKTVIVSAALDAGLVSPEDVFNCENGSIRIGTSIVRDAHAHSKLSVADIIKFSSNIGAYKVEQRLGPKRAYEAIRSFGFGGTSGIDLPGESAGLLTSSKRWSEVQFATIAFGQGIAATPLQMIMSFAAIANGGTLLKPYVVKRVVGDGGVELYSRGRKEIGRPISPATSKLMAGLLGRVTEKGGTGTLAASLEYPVAGKTGTAQKADPRTGGYAQGRYYSSFIGFAPSDDPRIAVYVGIDEPGGGMYYGGQVAAPAFRDIVDATLHYLKVPGSRSETSPSIEAQMPPRSETAELAMVEAEEAEPRQIVQHGESSWRLPDLRGLTMRGVLEAAGGVDIAWRFSGSGIAVNQRPEPGSIVSAGVSCDVEFKPLM
ncbi:MAG: penicillin-binding protein [Pseudomonadota bacterium]